MSRTAQSVASALTLIAALAACGGGGGSPSSVPAQARASASYSGNATLSIPLRPAQAAARQAQFISPAASSVGISVNGATATYADVSSTSTLCTTTTGTAAARTCTVPLSAPAGTDTFVFTFYQGATGTGNTLGVGTASMAISTPNFSLPVTVNGTVASIAVSVTDGANVIPGGYATSLPVVVTAKDASGAIIIGPGDYTNPITLTNADTSGVTALSTVTVTSPATAVTLTYAPTDANTGILAIGGLPVGATQIGASAPGVPPSAVTAGTFQYIADRFYGYAQPRTLTGTAQAVVTQYNNTGAPQPNASVYAYTLTEAYINHSGASFNGVSNLYDNHRVATYAQTAPATTVAPEVETRDEYRGYMVAPPAASTESLYGKAYVDVNAGTVTSPVTGWVAGTTDATVAYPASGSFQDDVLPHANTSWSDNGVPFTEGYTGAEVASLQQNADGSRGFTQTLPNQYTGSSTAGGTGTNFNAAGNGVTTNVGVPVAGAPGTAPYIPVTQQVTSPAPGPVSNYTPAVWYPGGTPQNPLYTDTYSEAFVAIPGACNVPSSIATQAWARVEQISDLEPQFFELTQETNAVYFVPGGVGDVCEIYAWSQSDYRFTTGVISKNVTRTYTIGVQSTSGSSVGRRPANSGRT